MENNTRQLYSDDYKHFDNLIWQVPAWGFAAFSGTFLILSEIVSKYSEKWGISLNTLLGLILLCGFMFLFSYSYALFRYRWHQKHVIDKTEPPFVKVGAQTMLQFSISLQSAILLTLSLHMFFQLFWLISVFVGIVITVIMTAFYELKIRNLLRSK